MNGERTKWLKRLVQTQNPVLLTLIRNKYGERTQEMGSRQIYKAAKKMWYQGEIQKVTKWPVMNQLKKLQ